MATVYAHYHPAMKNKWILYCVAGAATATNAMLWIKAGQHFPTDVIAGSIIVPAAGMLVPHFTEAAIKRNRCYSVLSTQVNSLSN